MLSKIYLEFNREPRSQIILRDAGFNWVQILTMFEGYSHPLAVKGGMVLLVIDDRRYWLPIDCFNVV
jgi:hypothetical protein